MEQFGRGHRNPGNGDHRYSGNVEQPVFFLRQPMEEEQEDADGAKEPNHDVAARANVASVERADGIVDAIAAPPHQHDWQDRGDQPDPETEVEIATGRLRLEDSLEVALKVRVKIRFVGRSCLE